MKFYQRFAYYLVGFTLGMFFVAAIWSGKDVRCSYFPNARVLNDIRNKPFHYSIASKRILSEGWITQTDIKNILTHGDVDFDQSNKPLAKGKLYVIEGKTTKNQDVWVEVLNYPDKALLKTIRKK